MHSFWVWKHGMYVLFPRQKKNVKPVYQTNIAVDRTLCSSSNECWHNDCEISILFWNVWCSVYKLSNINVKIGTEDDLRRLNGKHPYIIHYKVDIFEHPVVHNEIVVYSSFNETNFHFILSFLSEKNGTKIKAT